MSIPPTVETVKVELAAHERLVEARFAALDKALELQAGKYEVHLLSLNNENNRIAAISSAHISRELFDRLHAEHERRIKDNETRQAMGEGKSVGISLAIGAIVTLIGIALHFIT